MMETSELVQRALGLIRFQPSQAATASTQAVPPSAPHEPACERSAPGDLQRVMLEDYRAFVRWAATVYESFLPAARQLIFPKLKALQHQADQAAQVGEWPAFQSALMEARTLLMQGQPVQTAAPSLPKHWTYRAWSRVLDAEVWFVHCEEEVAQLAKQGIQRGSIYTEAEMVELLRLPQPSSKALKDLHMVKAFFNATVVPEDKDEPGDDVGPPPPPPVN